MRNMDDASFRPADRANHAGNVPGLFRQADAGEWVKTSVNMRPGIQRRLRIWAAGHDMKIQEVVDQALDAWMEGDGQ